MKLYRWEGRGTVRGTIQDGEKWIWCRHGKDGRPILSCERCGDEYVMNVPVEISVFCAALTAYADHHARCQPRAKSPAKKTTPRRRR